ncbi:M20/M25/M40 family metallo-hydrolase [Alkalihalobacillus macyae]|uniref:M20/M25/M40 family metallo-hydrolase n=1 Tax=Guptibacillus hwajinpoensis TaxID=208199 RepID=UPI00273C5073|nr:M20/M25/M40 family metallo-hydrolase [Alkalihalobacillus macyae]MDP4550154.1 M20/M25/M40 family metallo-hydrolase [Alkalihalobacillus macyae]
MGKWQTKETLMYLLTRLVEHHSVTGTYPEVALAEYIHLQLQDLSYFKENPDQLALHPTSDGRSFVTGLVKNGDSKKTVILISHFDVVDVEDFGQLKNLAFSPYDLTEEIYKNLDKMPEDVQEDLKAGEWLFGRGVMDMKAGLALQMSMLEKASMGAFDGNVLLLTVPDEEVNSLGMIEAVPVLVELANEYGLHYTACLNSEPVFTNYPGDQNLYVYTGSIGKLLPGFFCYGQETHVGEPFSGLNANYMAAEVTRELELNADFCEVIDGEVTPPPTNLMQKDLKEEYSVQIPHVGVTLFNVLGMESSIQDITDKLLKAVRIAAKRIEDRYIERATEFSKLQTYVPKPFHVMVLTYEQLHERAVELFGEAEIKRRQDYITANFKDLGDRDLSTRMVFDLAALCKEDGPMIILFYNPPFYPAVSSRHDPFIQETIKEIVSYSKENHQVTLKPQHYFPGLSDLSFVGLERTKETIQPLMDNMPLYGQSYELPLDALEQLKIPVMNLGPKGKDAHKWTERLEITYSFETLHDMLPYTIRKLLR